MPSGGSGILSSHTSTMATFVHRNTYRLPTGPAGEILEFSPTGQLAFSENTRRGIHIINCVQRLNATSFIDTYETPSSFVWDPVLQGNFFVGFIDGTFASFAKNGEQYRVCSPRDRGPITALALSSDSLVLVAIAGLYGVFVFRRNSLTGGYLSLSFTHNGSSMASQIYLCATPRWFPVIGRVFRRDRHLILVRCASHVTGPC